MPYLYVRNRWVANGGEHPPGTVDPITAEGKHVIVIGGGDTAMDCLANAHREGAKSVTVLDTYDAPLGPVRARHRARGPRRRAGWSPPTRSTRAASGAGRRPRAGSRAATGT